MLSRAKNVNGEQGVVVFLTLYIRNNFLGPGGALDKLSHGHGNVTNRAYGKFGIEIK